MNNKDILNALADALLGSGSAKDTTPAQKWYVCVPDETGGIKKHETTNLYQAKITVEDWLIAGYPAWLQDETGKNLTIAKKPKERN